MKKAKSFFLAIFLLSFFLLFVGGFYLWKVYSQPVSGSATEVDFVITKGLSASQIGNKLKEKNLIKSALAFKVYLQLTGNSGKIQAGEYVLSPDKSLPELIKEFLKGPTQIWVTVPEGLRREEVALKFAEGLEVDGEELDTFINDFLTLTRSDEGYLFPDTYLVPKDVSAQKVVSLMKNTFNARTSSLEEFLEKSDYPLDKIIIIASLIERETKTDEERPLVAGVIYNRLGVGMALQVDATLQYALADLKLNSLSSQSFQELKKIKFWEGLSSDGKEVNSLYNTYKYSGLPPTPICNPGLSSIKAALKPQESEYFYYLHNSSGKIYFAKTLEEHNANIRKYLNN